MTRILADLPEEDIRWLERHAAQRGKSRASVLREAVAAYRSEQVEQSEAERRRARLEAGFGAWKDRSDIGDPVEWQRRERASWTRPWDDDYEEVKAEFPDLLDSEDDRQREIYLRMVAARQSAEENDDA